MHNHHSALPEQQSHFIRSVLEGIREFSQAELETRLNRLQLSWLRPPFVVAVVAPDYTPVCFENKDDIIQQVKVYIQQAVAKQGYSAYCTVDAGNNIVLLLSLKDCEITDSTLDTLFFNLRKKLQQVFGLDLFISAGNVQKAATDIPVSHAEAKQMLAYKYQYSARGVILAANMIPYRHAAALSNTIAFDRVVGCFTDGNLGKLAVRLDELIEEIRSRPHVSRTGLQRTLAALVIHILNIASDSDQNAEAILKGRDPYHWILSQNNTPVIREWILQLCTQLIAQRQTQEENIELEIIRTAKAFIDENLGNAALSLQTVSDAVGLTAPYFSQLFSRETGKGVSAYITGLRMEFAGRLLTATSLKVDAIAAQAGFSSASYFNLVFKKTFGMTPTQYRKKAQKT